jgi:hypothetical protein
MLSEGLYLSVTPTPQPTTIQQNYEQAAPVAVPSRQARSARRLLRISVDLHCCCTWAHTKSRKKGATQARRCSRCSCCAGYVPGLAVQRQTNGSRRAIQGQGHHLCTAAPTWAPDAVVQPATFALDGAAAWRSHILVAHRVALGLTDHTSCTAAAER